MGNKYARDIMLKIAIMEDVVQVKVLDLKNSYEQFVLDCYEGDTEAYDGGYIYEKAREYIESGKYYWNSGMFIWEISSILNNYKKFLPEIYKYKEQISNNIRNEKDVLQNIYENVESISIDKGILEKSNNIKMVKGEFEWLDIGSINDFFKIQEKDLNNNVKKGNLIAEDIENCNIYNDDNGTIISTVGIKDLNIINSNNVILIANKDKMGELPNLIGKIKYDKKLKKYL